MYHCLTVDEEDGAKTSITLVRRLAHLPGYRFVPSVYIHSFQLVIVVIVIVIVRMSFVVDVLAPFFHGYVVIPPTRMQVDLIFHQSAFG